MAKTLITNNYTVATAGTRVQLSATTVRLREVVVQAKNGNSNTIYFGNSSVSSTNGFQLQPGQSFSLSELSLMTGENSFDLSTMYVDAATNGDQVVIAYIPY